MTPAWRNQAPTDRFLNFRKRPCVEHLEEYFDEGLEALATTRALCVKCPAFQACTNWSLAHHEDLPYGIFAGLTPEQRTRIVHGVDEYKDWRQDYLRSRVKQSYKIRRKVRAPNPPCPTCGRSDTVRKDGVVDNRQRYRCRECKHPRVFLGEEL